MRIDRMADFARFALPKTMIRTLQVSEDFLWSYDEPASLAHHHWRSGRWVEKLVYCHGRHVAAVDVCSDWVT